MKNINNLKSLLLKSDFIHTTESCFVVHVAARKFERTAMFCLSVMPPAHGLPTPHTKLSLLKEDDASCLPLLRGQVPTGPAH